MVVVCVCECGMSGASVSRTTAWCARLIYNTYIYGAGEERSRSLRWRTADRQQNIWCLKLQHRLYNISINFAWSLFIMNANTVGAAAASATHANSRSTTIQTETNAPTNSNGRKDKEFHFLWVFRVQFEILGVYSFCNNNNQRSSSSTFPFLFHFIVGERATFLNLFILLSIRIFFWLALFHRSRAMRALTSFEK